MASAPFQVEKPGFPTREPSISNPKGHRVSRIAIYAACDLLCATICRLRVRDRTMNLYRGPLIEVNERSGLCREFRCVAVLWLHSDSERTDNGDASEQTGGLSR